jgi:hypothetical protein
MANSNMDPSHFNFEYGEGTVYHSFGYSDFYTLRVSKDGVVLSEYDASQVVRDPVTTMISIRSSLKAHGLNA